MAFMKKFTILILGIILFASCDCIEGEGPVVEENRNLTDFDRIELRASADVFITKSNNFEVRIEGQQNILDVLTTRIKGRALIIGFEDICVINTRKLEIFISMPELTELQVSGSGNVESDDVLTTDNLYLGISGSGSIDLEVETESAEISVSGSGDVFLAGKAERFSSAISGSGNIRAERMQTNRARVKISGSGSTYIQALDELDVRISGSGNVHYSGNPEINTSVSGSGNVKRVR